MSAVLAVGTAVAAPIDRIEINEVSPTYRTNIVPSQTKNFQLLSLIPGGRAGDMRMTGMNNRHYFNFSVRRDEIVSDASIVLTYTPSPSLIPVWSQLNVYMNGQVQESLAIGKDEVGKLVTKRIKLAEQLAKRSTGKTIYILDEPTTGLHSADVAKLIEMLTRLVDAGNTVLVIEHNLDVIKTADYIIDLGPEGGDGGGTLVACGTPEQVAQNPASYTGEYLKKWLVRNQ